MKRLVVGIVLGLALMALAEGVLTGTSVTFLESASPPTPTPTLPPTVGQQLTAVQNALTQAKQSGKSLPVTIRLSEADLTTTALRYFPVSLSGGATLSNPVVHLLAGQLVLDCAANLAFLRTTAHLVTVPFVSGGKPAVRVDSATLGGQPLPDAVRDAAAAVIASAIASGVPANLTVTSIVLSPGTLTVQGTANP